MEPLDLRDVVKRLWKIEAQNRNIKRGGVIILALAAASLLIGQASPKSRVIEAEKFILYDSRGMTRAQLTMLASVGPRLSMTDNDGTERVVMGLTSDGAPLLGFKDKQGKVVRLDLSLDEDDSPVLRFWDKQGKARAALRLDADDSPALRFFDKDGKDYTLQARLSDAPSMYMACLQRKENDPKVDCTEYRMATEILMNMLRP